MRIHAFVSVTPVAIAVALSGALGLPQVTLSAAVAAVEVGDISSEVTVSNEQADQLLLEAIAKGEDITLDQAKSRADEEAAATPLIEYVQSHPETFGGVYADRSGGDLFFTVRYLPTADVAAAKALVAPIVNVTFLPATHSQAELIATMNAIGDAYNAQGAAGYNAWELVAAWPDLRNNRVVVESEYPDLVPDFAAAYGSFVVTAEGQPAIPMSCSNNTDWWNQSRFNCTTNRGGVALQRLQGDNDSNCTMGGWAKWVVSQPFKRVRVTANHCGSSWTGNQTFFHHGSSVGTSLGGQTCAYWHADCDARFVPTDSTPSKSQNAIYLATGPTNWTYSAIGAYGSGTEGASVRCVSGVGGGIHDPSPYDVVPYSCGYLVHALIYATEVNGPYAMHFGTADLDGSSLAYPNPGTRHNGISGGDSGAPVFSGPTGTHYFHGLAAADGGTLGALFTFADKIDNTPMYILWCLNADCSTTS